MTEDEIVGWYHRLNGHEFERTLGESEGQGSLECCSPWRHKGSDTTERLSNNKPPVGKGKALGGRRRPCRNAWTLCAQCPVYALGVRWVS